MLALRTCVLAAKTRALRSILSLAAVLLPLVISSTAFAQLEGRPIAQPYFDFPTWARWSNCRPHPLMWQFDPFVPYAQPENAACASGDCGACPPPSNSCVEAFVAHRPNGIYAIADFAPLTYDVNNNVEIARIGPAGATALGMGDLQSDFNAGTRMTIGYVWSPCLRIEGGYFGTYSWEDNIAVTNLTANPQGGLGDLNTILSGFADVAGLSGNDLVTLAQFSAFNSQELNARYWLDVPPGPFDVSLTLGLRHLATRESLAFTSRAGAGNVAGSDVNNALLVNTANDLWGGQLGVQVAWLQSAHTWLEFDGKGMMFHNNASQNSNYVRSDVVAPFLTARDQQRTAWGGDISLAYNIQFTPGLVLRLGYQAVFLNGVALSADNIQRDNNLLQNGPAQLDDSGEVVYHGPVIGLMWNR